MRVCFVLLKVVKFFLVVVVHAWIFLMVFFNSSFELVASTCFQF